MTLRRSQSLSALLFSGLSLLIARHAYATAMSMANITFSLHITSDPGTSVVFSDNWTAEAFAQANNSLGQLQTPFDSSQTGTATADTKGVTWADGHGQADPVHLIGGAQSNANIPGTTLGQASSQGQGTLFNFFEITTNDPNATDVQVDFSVDLAGGVSAFTDTNGLSARSEVIFDLEVDGARVNGLFLDSLLSINPNSPPAPGIPQMLSGSLTLQPDTPYFLLAEADAESMVANTPEPSTLALMLTGFGALTGFARKMRAGTTPP